MSTIPLSQINAPHVGTWRNQDFSQWHTTNLPGPNTGLMIGNQDWIFWNYRTKKLMLCEEKCFGNFIDPKGWQFKLFRDVIDPALSAFCSMPRFLKQAGKECQIIYLGYHYITFENTSPDNGAIFWDNVEISKEELIERLSLK